MVFIKVLICFQKQRLKPRVFLSFLGLKCVYFFAKVPYFYGKHECETKMMINSMHANSLT